MRKKKKKLVLLIHGINTRAYWYDEVAPILRSIDGVTVKPLSYGYFDVFRFLLPGPLRRGPIAKIERELMSIFSSTEAEWQGEVSIIAHSFGSYAIVKALENNDFSIRHLILCGSVLPEGYNFSSIRKCVSGHIVNDVGFRDIWPVIAKITTFGYGSAGTFGFGSTLCEDRHHNYSHGEFFNFPFIHHYWKSLIQTGKVVPSEFSRSASRRPLIILVLSILPTGAVIFLFLFILLTLKFFF